MAFFISAPLFFIAKSKDNSVSDTFALYSSNWETFCWILLSEEIKDANCNILLFIASMVFSNLFIIDKVLELCFSYFILSFVSICLKSFKMSSFRYNTSCFKFLLWFSNIIGIFSDENSLLFIDSRELIIFFNF